MRRQTSMWYYRVPGQCERDDEKRSEKEAAAEPDGDDSTATGPAESEQDQEEVTAFWLLHLPSDVDTGDWTFEGSEWRIYLWGPEIPT